jgi:predicted  nucleic acid-binding Zn-ribbon protein
MALGADLRIKNDQLAALRRQIEIMQGEAELVTERLELEVAETKGEATHLSAKLSLFVEQLEQVQREYRQIFVSAVESHEFTEFPSSTSAPSLRAMPKKAGLQKLAQAIGERDNRILSLGHEIIDLDGRIRTLRQELARRDNRILILEQAEREVVSRDGRILELGREVASRDGRILELGREVASRDGRILELGQEIANRDGRIFELERQFGILLTSRSWRITAPLRAAIGYMNSRQIRFVRSMVWRRRRPRL